MARVVLEHLTKRFPARAGGGVRAVEDLCLTVAEGELLVLVGPSGCGKTTTLRLIAGLEEATHGTISLDGRPMMEVPAKDREVAMVFQHHALYPHLSVFENLAFGLRVRHCPRPELEKRVAEVVKMLGLEECAARLPGDLSGGQRQRAALGRAIVRRPKLFLFDEPLSSLDGPLRAQLRTELARLHTRLAATAVYVTHDQGEAVMLGHRIGVMREGVLQQVARPLDLYHQPANRFVAGFFGSPPMNFFNGTLLGQGEALYFRGQGQNDAGSGGFSLRVEPSSRSEIMEYTGKPVVLGVRPEHIAPAPSRPASDQSVQAVIELVQPTGAEVCLSLAAGPHLFVARLPGADSDRFLGRGSFSFDMRQAHFFDPATDRRIGGESDGRTWPKDRFEGLP